MTNEKRVVSKLRKNMKARRTLTRDNHKLLQGREQGPAGDMGL